jgi:hypothetical protein
MKSLKILTIEATGYRFLAPHFKISLLSKTRVDPDGENGDLSEFAPGFYLPNEYAFIGKNSSGKTSVLSLIDLCYTLLVSGRVMVDPFVPANCPLDLVIVFVYKEKLYRYTTHLIAPQFSSPYMLQYYLIADESFEEGEVRTRSDKTLSNIAFKAVKGFTPRGGGKQDTTSLPSSTYDPSIGVWSIMASSVPFDSLLASFFSQRVQKDAQGEWVMMMLNKILHLLDDGIEYIYEGSVPGNYRYKRQGQEEITLTASALALLLSSGTKRGFVLYGSALGALLSGTNIIVDEIETDFNKNLVYNLFFLFNDPSINTKGATLIFSTHYIEILDILPRNDNIDVLHRDGNVITLKNIAEDYKSRPALLKSTQFDSNAFDTLLNYDLLMDFTKELRKRCAVKKD